MTLIQEKKERAAHGRPKRYHMQTPFVVIPVTSVLNSSIADFMMHLLFIGLVPISLGRNNLSHEKYLQQQSNCKKIFLNNLYIHNDYKDDSSEAPSPRKKLRKIFIN